jgi:hypothetical protein
MNIMKNALLYWPRFFKEAWITRKYYKAVKAVEPELTAAGLRVDYIGRIYGVVEIQSEFLGQPDLVQQSLVFQQLGPINDILVKYGLSDLSYPEISKIPGSAQYLVVLYPDNDYFTWTAVVRNLLFAGIVAAVGFFINWIISMF